MKRKVFGILAAGLLAAVPAMAQDTPPAPTYNCDFQPSCEVAPGLYGKISEPVTSKFKLSIGGYVKLDYAYNSVSFGSGAPARSAVQVPKSTSVAGKQDQSVFTARQSRLWFKVAGPTFMGAKTNALLEADFYGSGSSNEAPDFRLRHAYGSLDWPNTQILFGQTSDIFGPAVPSTVDFLHGATYGTPNQPRVPQVRLTQKVDLNASNSLKLVVGLQNPVQNNYGTTASTPTSFSTSGSAVNVAGQAMWISKALGVAPGFYGMAMNSLTVGVFGLWGNQDYQINASGDTKSLDSWGYGLYTFVPLIKSKDGKSRAMTMSLEAQAFMAANMAFNGATAGVAVEGSDGYAKPAKGFGAYGQLIFYPTQDLGITAGYERRNAIDSSSYGDNYEQSNTNIYLNVAYDLNAAIRVAAEYQNLNTHYGHNNPSGSGSLAGSGNGTANIARFAAYYFF
ncbi:MAG: hypothetical protein EG828_09390 [Deltaproteobacteria bacterium]|nr:hypothetical protein [Deltaproteobacteria bacterium]